MVESMNGVLERGRDWQNVPRVVEIVGPAGAGKTTLCRALNRHSEYFQLGRFPSVRKITDAPFFIWNGLRLIPSLLHLHQPNSWRLSRREFAWMSILHGWPAALQKEKRDGNRTIILDQGPVYLIAEMKGFGSECLRSQKAESMWQEVCGRWAASLDMIVWMDASDEILLERIRTRPKEHIAKHAPRSMAFEFLEQFREVYRQIISVLASNAAGLRVLNFDTGRERPDEIVNRILAESDVSLKTQI